MWYEETDSNPILSLDFVLVCLFAWFKSYLKVLDLIKHARAFANKNSASAKK